MLSVQHAALPTYLLPNFVIIVKVNESAYLATNAYIFVVKAYMSAYTQSCIPQ